MLKTKSRSIKRIKPIIDELVEQKLYDMLGDPDEGLKLKLSVKKKLENSVKKRSKGIPAKQAAEELGLKW